MGMILIAFSLIAFVSSFFPETIYEEEEEILNELQQAPPPINLYLVTIALGVVGATCITIAWRKKNAFENSDR